MTFIAIGSPIAINFTDANRRGEHVADTYARGLLEELAPDAVYFGGGDHTIFPLVYMQVAEGIRPDVVLANRYGYTTPAAYSAAGEAPPAGRPAPAEEDRILQAILANTDRPVYSAAPRLVPNVTRVNEGLLYRYLRPGETRADNPPMDVPAAVLDTRGDWNNELIAHEYYAARGRALFDAGRPSEALDALDRAARYVHEDKSALNNLGLNAAEGGEVAAAAVYFHRALTTDPAFLPAALNLARCYLTQNTPQEAIAVLENLEAKGARDARLDEMKRAALEALNGH
jgi:tetratricopeptide (TPR) repeat protein